VITIGVGSVGGVTHIYCVRKGIIRKNETFLKGEDIRDVSMNKRISTEP